MSAQSAFSHPAVVRPTSLDRGGRRTLLNELVVEHGPRDEIARRILVGDTALREHGIVSSFCSIEELCAVNQANPDSWNPLFPVFDPVVGGASDDNTYAVVGKDANGRAAYAMATRLYDIGATTFKEEVESLRLLYRDPEACVWAGEAIECTAPIAAHMRGKICYTGAAWVHPRHRGKHLQHLFRPIGRMITLTRWNPDYVATFMAKDTIATGAARKAKFHLDYAISIINTPLKRGDVVHAGLAWATGQEQSEHVLGYFEDRLALKHSQIDRGVVEASDKEQASG